MTFNKSLLFGFGLLGLGIIFYFIVEAKDENQDVKSYVKSFCACAEEFAPSQISFLADRLDEQSFHEARSKHLQCLGKRNPFSGKTPEDSLAFLRDFVHDIRIQCPDAAKTVGFKID